MNAINPIKANLIGCCEGWDICQVNWSIGNSRRPNRNSLRLEARAYSIACCDFKRVDYIIDESHCCGIELS